MCYIETKGEIMSKIVLKTEDQNLIAKVQLFAQAEGVEFQVEKPESNVVALPVSNQNKLTIAQLEQKAIVEAIENCNGNLSKTAKTLGIGRATLYRKVKEYNIETQSQRKSA